MMIAVLARLVTFMVMTMPTAMTVEVIFRLARLLHTPGSFGTQGRQVCQEECGLPQQGLGCGIDV